MSQKLKEDIIKLLKEDVDFRYTVAGLIGLEEILKRLDKQDEKFIEIIERLDRHESILEKHSSILEKQTSIIDKHAIEMVKLREDMNKGFERYDKEIFKLREDMNKGFERYDKEIFKLREDMNKGFERYEAILEKHSMELIKLREDMLKGFERHEAILDRHEEELIKLREDMLKGFERHEAILDRHEEELIKLREDMNKGFELVNRHISALGARWGLIAEEAFREGIKGLLEKEFNILVERWEEFDEDGIVYGYPSIIEIDVTIKDEKITLIEITSHARASDLKTFKMKSIFYEKKTKKKPDRLLMVTPYADENAIKASKELGIELYTKV